MLDVLGLFDKHILFCTPAISIKSWHGFFTHYSCQMWKAVTVFKFTELTGLMKKTKGSWT